MKSFTYTIKAEHGLNERPASEMVTLTKKFPESEIRITNCDRSVKTNQIMLLLALGVEYGDTVTITVNGGDEQAALNAMQEFMESKL